MRKSKPIAKAAKPDEDSSSIDAWYGSDLDGGSSIEAASKKFPKLKL